MLAPPDANLIRRDPALPGLALLLDSEALAARLRRFAGAAELETPQLTYIKYKPQTNCLVGYRACLRGTPLLFYAVAYTPAARNKLEKACRQPGVPGPLGPGRLVLEENAIVVSFFPNDRKLLSLPLLADRVVRKTSGSEFFRDCPDLWEGPLESLVYRPERRYVAKLIGNQKRHGVLRVYNNKNYAAARTNALAFHSGDLLRIARCLGHSELINMLALEWLPGQPLGRTLAGPLPEEGHLGRVAQALAELHRQNLESLVPNSHMVEATSLAKVAQGLGFVCPHLKEHAQDLSDRLGTCLINLPAMHCPIHGDFYPDQVLLDGNKVAILDLDEAGYGDPAIDLGNFLAHLERDGLQGLLPPGQAERLGRTLLESYPIAADPSLRSRFWVYAAVRLFRLAPHSFRKRRLDWPQHTESILDRVAVLLEEGNSRGGLAVSVPGAVRTGKTSSQSGEARRTLKATIPILDPFGAAADPAMRFLARALDPVEVQDRFAVFSIRLAGATARHELQTIRVCRYKAGRRCLVEYDLEVEPPGLPAQRITLLGKGRAKGPDQATCSLLEALWNHGFAADSPDAISVPEPLGILADFHMWFQRKVPGTSATRLLLEADGVRLAQRIAEAIHKLHQGSFPTFRRHTMSDELRILRQRLEAVAQARPQWSSRLQRLLDACARLRSGLPRSQLRTIHRDFYPDQVIVAGQRIYLLDFDLCCQGEVGLDVGNFAGHLIEQGLRTLGDPAALADREQALVQKFLELSGETTLHAIRVYTTLTLARHIYLSTQFPERCPFTEILLELCESRCGITGQVKASIPDTLLRKGGELE